MSQPLWGVLDITNCRPKRAQGDLMKLARSLVSVGRFEEASVLAVAIMRGFVSLACQGRLATHKLVSEFFAFVEIFSCESSLVSPLIIRLYNRLLHVKNAQYVDWEEMYRPILRSCALNGASGGNASALADLQRKSKIWRLNTDVGGGSASERSSDTSSSDTSSSDSSSSDLSDNSPKRRRKNNSPVENSVQVAMNKSEILARQRHLPLISDWLIQLSLVNRR